MPTSAAKSIFFVLTMTFWIDTHCHLDAPEFSHDVAEVSARAGAAGVRHCVLPAVCVGNFEAVQTLAQAFSYSYALGIHPLAVAGAQEQDLQTLDAELALHQSDPRLVAVGEIGLDYFVPELQSAVMRERQEFFYRSQLKLARKHELPVILHVRRSSDKLLKHLRELVPPEGCWRGIAHAFNGSEQQAAEFIKLGFKLGFGGAVTFEPALQLRRLASKLPLDTLVMETDSPDIPPHWVYKTAAQRATGQAQGRNEPGELPAISQQVAQLRAISIQALAEATTANAFHALPRLKALLAC
jgi:TatD DNase family protein